MTDEIKRLEHIFNVHYKICFALIVTCGITAIILAVVSMIIGRILEVFIVIGGVLFIACLVSQALMSSAKTKLFNEIYRHLDETWKQILNT